MLRRHHNGRNLAALLILVLNVTMLPARLSAAAADADAPLFAVDEPEGSNPNEPPASRYAEARAGYRFVTPTNAAGHADPYTRFKSGVGGGATVGTIGSDLKLTADAIVYNEDDYHAELFLDYRGVYRLHLESQALWHNIHPEQLPPGAAGIYASTDLTPGASYGTRTALTQAEGRIRPGKHPFHLGLGYWQLGREGTSQSFFSDHSFGDSQSKILSFGKRIDHEVREGTAAVDGFFGLFGLSYAFRIRDFSNNAPDSRYGFSSTAGGALIPGSQSHDVVSDSQVTSHTFKLYSDLSGGLVGTGSYTLTRRENMADRGDARPSSRPTDTQQFISGDVSYTPIKELAFVLAYRRLEITRESPSTIFSPFASIPTVGTIPGVFTATPGLLLVRPAMDTVADSLTLSTTYRPTPVSSLRLEYRAELESRDNVPDPLAPDNPAAVHGDRRQAHTGKASFNWRPYKGVKLNGSYSYAVSDNPAYTASFSDRHSGQLFVSYASNGSWGANASFIGRYETGEDALAVAVAPAGLHLQRESRNKSVNASLWFSPLERLVLTTSYSYLRSDTDQEVLFSRQSAGSLAATSYRSAAHVYGIDAAYAFSELLDLSLGFQQVWSSSRFQVPPIQDVTLSTDGITGLTSMEALETGVSARADWRITQHIGCSLDYRFRQYDADNRLFDGSVHATLLLLTARW